jgi:GR25 family glycosyltransferase involved in LPS biosynthesis
MLKLLIINIIIIIIIIIVYLLFINNKNYNNFSNYNNKFQIKKVYYINLEKRTDRKEMIENMLNKTNLKYIYSRFNAIDGTNKEFVNKFKKTNDFNKYFNHNVSLSGAQFAVSMSHIKIWESIVNNKSFSDEDCILILEDDAIIKPSFNKKYNHFVNSLQKNNINPDIMPMGILGPKGKKINDNLFELHYGWGTHAYVIKKNTCKKLLSFIKINNALDDYLFNVHITKLNIIKPLKNIIIQNRDISSDINVGFHYKPEQ